MLFYFLISATECIFYLVVFVDVPKGGETMKEISVEWTGSWPCLCHGEWKLTIDGEDWS